MTTMSEMKSAPAGVPSGNDAEASGFRSFWRSSRDFGQNVTFVPQDPAPRRGSRLSSIFRRGSNAVPASPEDKKEPEDKNESEKRREQVYNAQKRHRNRKAEYVQKLEAEIARLQRLDSEAHSQRNNLAYENNIMRELLASHSIDLGLGSVALEPSVERLSTLGSAYVDVRFDPDIGHERTFLDPPDMERRSSHAASATPPARKVAKGDAWAAVEFILALEWPCQGHICHKHINPEAKPIVACEDGEAHGHALTTTASVFESALPPSAAAQRRRSSVHLGSPKAHREPKWQLPHSEIDKLIKLSENLPLDDEEMTPAQAYSAIRQAVTEDRDIKPVLARLKIQLAGRVECKGLGAVLPASVFWQDLDITMQKLGERLGSGEFERT